MFSRRFFAHPGHLARLLSLHLADRENGETLFYELTCGGVRVQVMGSLNLLPETEYPTGVDWLILPFQGRSDIDDYAVSFVERLRPRSILLDHYDDVFSPMSADVPTEGFCEIIRDRFGIPCRALTKYETLSLSTGGEL